MASEIRANKQTNRVGLGTVTYTDTGIIVSGIVTANSFKGDGSQLTGVTSVGGTTGVSFDDNVKIKVGTHEDIEIYNLNEEKRLLKIMVESNMVTSSGEGKRLIKQGAVKIDESKISDINYSLQPDKEYVLKVGKRRFLKIK